MTTARLTDRSDGSDEPAAIMPTGRTSEPVADPHQTSTRGGAIDGPIRAYAPVEYLIRDVTGTPIAVHVRRETPDGKKLSWQLPDGTSGLRGLKTADLPLFGVDRLGKGATVVITEGEKAAEALLGAGVQAVGTVTGAAGTPGARVLAELTGRAVVLWPDNDDVGRKHMERIATGLVGIASSIHQIAWREAPDGGDAADYLASGRTAADVYDELIDAAMDVQTRPPDALASPSDDGDESAAESRKSQASVLMDLASNVELFHAPDSTVYAHMPVETHRETWALGSPTFGTWLRRAYWQKTGRAASAQALQDALGVLTARGQFDGPEQVVEVRLAHRGEAIYLDLGDREWRAVEVTSAGWSVVADPPVRFRRPKGLLALPEPTHGGSLDAFRELVNLSDENQWRLVIAWLVASLRPDGPYPVLILGGEQGSAKSTTARLLGVSPRVVGFERGS